MKKILKRTIVYKVYNNCCTNKRKLLHERNKLFPGKVRWVDLCNARYISRKPIYDFLITHKDYMRGRVLDFGCGSMEYKQLFDKAEEYIGLDIEGAQDRGFYADGVLYYDGVHIPFAEEQFDSVLSIEVFEHVEFVEQILKELNKIVKRGGHMVFTVPMNYPCHLEPYDYRRFTKYGIEQMLEKCGFSVEVLQGSTTFRNTIRRLDILETAKRRGNDWLYKCKVLFSNISFTLTNSREQTDYAPIDWLVICKKV